MVGLVTLNSSRYYIQYNTLLKSVVLSNFSIDKGEMVPIIVTKEERYIHLQTTTFIHLPSGYSTTEIGYTTAELDERERTQKLLIPTVKCKWKRDLFELGKFKDQPELCYDFGDHFKMSSGGEVFTKLKINSECLEIVSF